MSSGATIQNVNITELIIHDVSKKKKKKKCTMKNWSKTFFENIKMSKLTCN